MKRTALSLATHFLLTLFANVGEFRKQRPEDSFRGWIWTIAQNKIRDHFRRRAGTAQPRGGSEGQDQLAELAAAEPDGLEEPADADDRNLLTHLGLNAVRGRFADLTWQAFWRITVGSESPAHVAADLGLSLRPVYQAKYRVLSTIHQELTDLM